MGKHIDELRDMLCEELDKIASQGELTAGSLDTIDKLTHSIKSIDTIEAMEEAGYSQEMYGGTYGGNSYARRRDSMGRYSRTGRGSSYRGGRSGNSYRGYSREDGKEQMLHELEEMRKRVEEIED